MSKKQDHIRNEQSRDKHAGKAKAKGNPADFQQPQSPKLANDHNKMGEQEPTQKNEGQRTPQSRHDRLDTAGSHNQVQARTGGKGGGRGPDGAG